MCGNESAVRIERAGNGYLIDAYTPGGKDKPGMHKRSVATTPEHVMRAVGAHLGARGKKRKGIVVMGEDAAAYGGKKKTRRKSAARKQAY